MMIWMRLVYLQPGAFWEGEPKGKVTKLGGLDAYFSESSMSTGKGVVLLSDIFGESKKIPSSEHECIYV